MKTNELKRVLSLLAVVAIVATFCSCNKMKNRLVGEWKCASVFMYEGEQSVDLTSTYEGDVWAFRSDDTYYLNGNYEGDYSVNAGYVYITFKNQDFISYEIFRLDNSQLELNRLEFREDPLEDRFWVMSFTRN